MKLRIVKAKSECVKSRLGNKAENGRAFSESIPRTKTNTKRGEGLIVSIMSWAFGKENCSRYFPGSHFRLLGYDSCAFKIFHARRQFANDASYSTFITHFLGPSVSRISLRHAAPNLSQILCGYCNRRFSGCVNLVFASNVFSVAHGVATGQRSSISDA